MIDPVSPYGYGGTHADGTPCFPDWAGTGGAAGAPEFVSRLAAGDRSGEGAASPRNVLTSAYWSPEPPGGPRARGDAAHRGPQVRDRRRRLPRRLHASENWPGFAPGTRGILNALSGKHCNWTGIVDLDPKPPILWTHGSEDIVVADGSPWEVGHARRSSARSRAGPVEEVFPPQPMVWQIRSVLERYRDAGGRVEMEMFDGSGHFPPIDAAERWSAMFFAFLDSAE